VKRYLEIEYRVFALPLQAEKTSMLGFFIAEFSKPWKTDYYLYLFSFTGDI